MYNKFKKSPYIENKICCHASLKCYPLNSTFICHVLTHQQRLFSPVPERPPLYITYSSPSSTTLLLHWAPIQPQFKNGIIRGFKVEYQENQPNAAVEVRERRLVTWVLLSELKKFTVYSVRVRAFTTVGDGPENNITVITSQDGTNFVFKCSIVFCFVSNSFQIILQQKSQTRN